MPRSNFMDDVDNPDLERAIERSGVKSSRKTEETAPMYAMIGASKIPVSKHMGKLWQSRRDQGLTCQQNSKTCWNEAIRYYNNDQTYNRFARDNSSGNLSMSTRLNQQWTETENVVFSNCAIMVPMLYAKNPTITASSDNDAFTDLCKAIDRLGVKLMSMKEAPGLNFKIKARRLVLTTLLTNAGFLKINWTQKQDADVTALEELQKLSLELQNAKSRKEIVAVEGKIMALEEKIALLSPAGPSVSNLTPDRIVVDPTSLIPDGEDALWMMEWDYLPTAYINAVYGKDKDGQVISIYQPTHVLSNGAQVAEDDSGDSSSGKLSDVVNNFVAIKDQQATDAATFGYDDVSAYRAACYTKVWYVWDKVTRRVYMFADNSWTWPIWVWDDPLKLPRFFPYFRLWFHESTNNNAPKGEVTYYLDQQDAINEISDEERRARAWARRNVLYDKNKIGQQDVEQVLRGPDGTARGIDVPEGMKLDDLIFSFTTPSMKFPELFNKDGKFAAINRITGVNDAMRGAQFKTNTTNQAINFYNQAVEVRTDEKVDLIEDCIGNVMWNIIMLCLMNWETEDVAPLIGSECAQYWMRITDNRMFDTQLNLRVEGGSINKPNSREKKQQCLELGQVLGQFANAAPATILVMLKMFERSFPEFVITDEEWKLIEQTMMMSLQTAGAGPQGQAQQGAGAGSEEEQIRQVIEQLPPEAKAQLEAMVQQGVPASQALQQIQAQMQQQAQ